MRGDGVKVDPLRLQSNVVNLEGLMKKKEKAEAEGDDYKIKKYQYHLRLQREKLNELIGGTQLSQMK